MTRCEQPDSLLRERRETLCSLEADHDQVGSVVSSEFEGMSAVDGCMRSLGGIEAPETLGVARIPSVVTSVVPVFVVSKCVLTSVVKCVLSSTHCVSETPCASERLGVSERVCVRETVCVRERYVREMTVGMREHAAASPRVSVIEWNLSVVTRRCAWLEWRRRRRQVDKGRVAAVVGMGTAPGLHSSEREVRAVLRTRPPRARLRE